MVATFALNGHINTENCVTKNFTFSPNIDSLSSLKRTFKNLNKTKPFQEILFY